MSFLPRLFETIPYEVISSFESNQTTLVNKLVTKPAISTANTKPVRATPVENKAGKRNVTSAKTVRNLTNPDEFTPFEEAVFEITTMAEELVVSKRARVVEELIISKQVTVRTQVIRDTVRHTEVEVEKLDNYQSLSSSKFEVKK